MSEAVKGDQPNLSQALEILRGDTPSHLRRGIEALEFAVEAKEPEASCLLAVFAAIGIGIPQSWPRALDLLLGGAQAGSSSARRQLALLAGAGYPQSLADAGDSGILCRLRDSISLERWTSPPDKRVLCKAPVVVAIGGFLSDEVCAWLVGRAADRLRPALLYGGQSTSPQRSAARTNSAFEIDVLDFDLVILMVRARIAATLGVPVRALEPPQIMHYEVGEEFAPHRDFLAPELPGHAADIARQGQRIVTFLIYLNSEFEGGETDFPVLALAYKGATGDALYFGNVDSAGVPDPRTLHAGLPPTRGEKWLFSQWVRDRVRA
jgi:prolyl 4-hydroxylase